MCCTGLAAFMSSDALMCSLETRAGAQQCPTQADGLLELITRKESALHMFACPKHASKYFCTFRTQLCFYLKPLVTFGKAQPLELCRAAEGNPVSFAIRQASMKPQPTVTSAYRSAAAVIWNGVVHCTRQMDAASR